MKTADGNKDKLIVHDSGLLQDVDPRYLTQWIKKSYDAKDLMRLYAQHNASFNKIHISATWMTLCKHLNVHARASTSSRSGYTRFRTMPATLQWALLPLMRQTAEMALKGELEGRELANVMYGVARSRVPDNPARAGLFDVLAAAAASKLRDLKPQEISNSAWAYATAGHAAPKLFEGLAQSAMPLLIDFSPQELSNMAWSYATAREHSPRLFDRIADASVKRVGDFNPQNLANMAWAFATARHPAPRLFDVLAIEASASLDKFNEQNLANTAWAFATAGHAAPELYNSLSAAVDARIGSFKPQELANLAWAYSTAGPRSPKLYEALAATADVRGVEDFKPQAVANTAWSYAFAGHTSPKLFASLARVAAAQAADFTPRSIANTVWAYATSAQSAPALFTALARAATTAAREDRFTAGELANIAWAYATTGHSAANLFDALAEAAIARARDFEPQQVSMLVWAYATERHAAPYAPPRDHTSMQILLLCTQPQQSPCSHWPTYLLMRVSIAPPCRCRSMLDALAHECTFLATSGAGDRAAEFTPRSLAATAWSYAALGHAAPMLFEALASAAGRTLQADSQSSTGRNAFTSSDLASIAWAYAVADHEAPQLFGRAFVARCESTRLWFDDELSQMHQWQLWHLERGMAPPLSPDLAERCRVAFGASIAGRRQPTSGVRHVSEALGAIGAAPSAGAVSSIGYAPDLEVTWRGTTVGILVEAPDDFIARPRDGAALGDGGDAAATPRLTSDRVVFDDRSDARKRKDARAGFVVKESGDRPATLASLTSTAGEGGEHAPRGRTVLLRRQLSTLGEAPLVCLPFWLWKTVLPGNKYSKAAGGVRTPQQLGEEIAAQLDTAIGYSDRAAAAEGGRRKTRRGGGRATAPPPRRRREQAQPVARGAPLDERSERGPAGGGGGAAGEATALLSWNEFRKREAGQGLSMSELAAKYREYKSRI